MYSKDARPLLLLSFSIVIKQNRASKQAGKHNIMSKTTLSLSFYLLSSWLMPSEEPVHPAEHHLVPFHPFLPLPFQLLVHLVLSFLPCYLLAVPVPVVE